MRVIAAWPLLLPTYHGDVRGVKVENKRNVTRRKKVTKQGQKKKSKCFQVHLFQQKLENAESWEVTRTTVLDKTMCKGPLQPGPFCAPTDPVVLYLPVAGQPGQEGLQPALLTLAVRIHEDEHVPSCPCSSQHPTSDDSKPLVAPDQFHAIQLGDVFTQGWLQGPCHKQKGHFSFDSSSYRQTTDSRRCQMFAGKMFWGHFFYIWPSRPCSKYSHSSVMSKRSKD